MTSRVAVPETFSAEIFVVSEFLPVLTLLSTDLGKTKAKNADQPWFFMNQRCSALGKKQLKHRRKLLLKCLGRYYGHGKDNALESSSYTKQFSAKNSSKIRKGVKRPFFIAPRITEKQLKYRALARSGLRIWRSCVKKTVFLLFQVRLWWLWPPLKSTDLKKIRVDQIWNSADILWMFQFSTKF